MAYPMITIKAARVNSNISQARAAKRLNVTTGTLSRWENGTTVPGWDKVQEMSTLYSVPIDYLFFERKYA